MLQLVLTACSNSCSPTEKSGTAINTALDSLKAHYAPDHRVAVFDVTYVQQGSVTVAKGDVDEPKAKEEALATLHKILGGQVIDSIRVLPDPQLGEKRFGIVAVSVGNVRSNPRNSAELATQAMMGMVVNLLKKQGDGTYVQMPDKYHGWLEENAMRVTNAAGVEAWKSCPEGDHDDVFHNDSRATKRFLSAHPRCCRRRPDEAKSKRRAMGRC